MGVYVAIQVDKTNMLNKNTLGKKREDNQKQRQSNYVYM